jgi:hypothetical protein
LVFYGAWHSSPCFLSQTRLFIQEADLHSSTGEPWLIPVIIGILVSLVVSLILLVRFCCVRPTAHKKLLKKEELAVARPDLLHPSLQFDNKVCRLLSLFLLLLLLLLLLLPLYFRYYCSCICCS